MGSEKAKDKVGNSFFFSPPPTQNREHLPQHLGNNNGMVTQNSWPWENEQKQKRPMHDGHARWKRDAAATSASG